MELSVLPFRVKMMVALQMEVRDAAQPVVVSFVAPFINSPPSLDLVFQTVNFNSSSSLSAVSAKISAVPSPASFCVPHVVSEHSASRRKILPLWSTLHLFLSNLQAAYLSSRSFIDHASSSRIPAHPA